MQYLDSAKVKNNELMSCYRQYKEIELNKEKGKLVALIAKTWPEVAIGPENERGIELSQLWPGKKELIEFVFTASTMNDDLKRLFVVMEACMNIDDAGTKMLIINQGLEGCFKNVNDGGSTHSVMSLSLDQESAVIGDDEERVIVV